MVMGCTTSKCLCFLIAKLRSPSPPLALSYLLQEQDHSTVVLIYYQSSSEKWAWGVPIPNVWDSCLLLISKGIYFPERDGQGRIPKPSVLQILTFLPLPTIHLKPNLIALTTSMTPFQNLEGWEGWQAKMLGSLVLYLWYTRVFQILPSSWIYLLSQEPSDKGLLL